MAEKLRVLVIDDEPQIRRFLRASLTSTEFDLHEAGNGNEGIQLTATWNPAIVLLDLGLPDISGIEVLKRIREWSQLPIIVLSASGQEQDKVIALDSGADDYLTKPFSVGELLARIRVALRHARQNEINSPIFKSHGLMVDLVSRQVFKNEQEVHLTPLEFKLLSALIKHAGRVITHRQLLTEVWGVAYADQTHYLRIYMAQLREKLEQDPAQPKLFLTESGVGYRVAAEDL